MRTKIRETYLKKRYNAHLNLMRIMQYHGVHPDQIMNFKYNPANPNESINLLFPNVNAFAHAFQETVDQEKRIAILLGDKFPMSFINNVGLTITILFIEPDAKNDSIITKKVVEGRLRQFLNSNNMHNLSEDQLEDPISMIQGAKLTGEFTINMNLQLILYSDVPIDRATKNILLYYSSIVPNPIKHFSVDDLQYDPTIHKTGPKFVRALAPWEIDEIAAIQIGLPGPKGSQPLGQEILDEIEENRHDPSRVRELENRLRNLALSKLPTINSADPLVKWRGFKVGDILYIERRIVFDKVYYRRVVELEPEISKKKVDVLSDDTQKQTTK